MSAWGSSLTSCECLREQNMAEVLLGIDIETIPDAEALKTDTWKKYADKHEKKEDAAALHPAFAQIVSVAMIMRGFEDEEDQKLVRCAMDERKVLADVLEDVTTVLEQCRKKGHAPYLVGHNIKEFDMPMLLARYVKHGPKVPRIFSTVGKKPWEITWVRDTGDYVKNGWKMMSLDALCLICGVQTSKVDGMDGSHVWEEAKAGKLDHIGEYNLDDVRATLDCYEVLTARGLRA